MSKLLLPHGGLSLPVNCTVPSENRESFLSEAEGLVRTPVSDADLSSIYRLGDGGLSPLNGMMDSHTYNRVLDESVIEVDGRLYAWTIPFGLPITTEQVDVLQIGPRKHL